MKCFFEIFGIFCIAMLIWFALDTIVESKHRIYALENRIIALERK